MIGPVPRKTKSKRIVGAFAALGVATLMACGPSTYEIAIETPIQPKMDVSPFQRVLVAGFVAGGSEDVDANQETVRLLRSQLRTKSSLRVIDADIMSLVEIAQDQNKAANTPGGPDPDEATTGHDSATASGATANSSTADRG